VRWDAPRVVKAQSFALVDAYGKTVGVFAVAKSPAVQGSSSVALYDAQGREMWRAGGAQCNEWLYPSEPALAELKSPF